MPDELVPSEPEPVEPARTHPHRVTCEFCNSTLTARGQVLRLSEEAKRMRDMRDELEAAEKSVNLLEQEVTRLTSELTAAKEPAASVKRGASIAWK